MHEISLSALMAIQLHPVNYIHFIEFIYRLPLINPRPYVYVALQLMPLIISTLAPYGLVMLHGESFKQNL